MKFKELSSSGPKDFLRLKPGDEVRGVFRGDPVDFRQHWKDNRGYACPGRATCELCQANEKSAFRFRINFVIKENGAYVAKVFEQGKAVYEALKELHKDYNLETNTMKIKRIGSGTETVYNIVPVPNGAVSGEYIKAMEMLKLNSLSPFGQDATPTPEEPEEEHEEEDHGEDVPF